MNNADAAAYYRSRARHNRMLADQAEDLIRSAQYRELAAAFAKEADSRDGSFRMDDGQSG